MSEQFANTFNWFYWFNLSNISPSDKRSETNTKPRGQVVMGSTTQNNLGKLPPIDRNLDSFGAIVTKRRLRTEWRQYIANSGVQYHNTTMCTHVSTYTLSYAYERSTTRDVACVECWPVRKQRCHWTQENPGAMSQQSAEPLKYRTMNPRHGQKEKQYW